MYVSDYVLVCVCDVVQSVLSPLLGRNSLCSGRVDFLEYATFSQIMSLCVNIMWVCSKHCWGVM